MLRSVGAKVATIEQSRVVPQSQAQGRHEQDLYHVKVEIT